MPLSFVKCITVFLALSLLSLFSPLPLLAAPQIKPFAIYGADNRLDLYQVKDPNIRKLAKASVGIFKAWELLDLGGGSETITGDSLGNTENLCSGEAFEEQRVGPYCSGVLVAPDIVVTAWHCMKYGALGCMGVKFAFGFSLPTKNHEYWNLNTEDVYACHSIIFQQEDDDLDLAVVRLDRAVWRRSPVKMRKAKATSVDTEVFVIGHPAALPQKVAGGAKVRSVEDGTFSANLDTFSHNSGSPVFNAKTYELEGILVSGDDDYSYQKK